MAEKQWPMYYQNPVPESQPETLEVYGKAGSDGINGCAPSVNDENSPEERAAMNVALYALALLK
jgi:hypothetical protein